MLDASQITNTVNEGRETDPEVRYDRCGPTAERHKGAGTPSPAQRNRRMRRASLIDRAPF
jgi:hypothetical protein